MKGAIAFFTTLWGGSWLFNEYCQRAFPGIPILITMCIGMLLSAWKWIDEIYESEKMTLHERPMEAVDKCVGATSMVAASDLTLAMTRIEQLEAALTKCRDRFQYYVEHHNTKGDYDKARGNEVFVDMIDEVLGEKL